MRKPATSPTPPPAPPDIFRYYKQSVEALGLLDRTLFESLAGGRALPESSVFYALGALELSQAMSAMRRELDCEVVLMLVASFEAVFQQDLQLRINRKKAAGKRRKKKDRISKALRAWRSKNTHGIVRWINIESLLDVWQTLVEPRHRQLIGDLKTLVRYRHWLAHGRYWNVKEKSGRDNVDPRLAWEIGRRVFDVLPGFHPLPSV